MSEVISPAVLKRWIRSELRRRREAAKKDQKDAAKRLECAPSRISHLESGRNLPDRATVETLFGFYGCPEAIEPFWSRVKQADSGKQVDIASDIDPGRFDLYAGLEEGATEKHGADLMALNGLVQVRGYSEPLLRFYDPDASDEEIERRLHLRHLRGSALTRQDNPLRLWLVISQHLLLDNVGGPAVMRDQLEHLLELSDLPNVDIQVLSPENDDDDDETLRNPLRSKLPRLALLGGHRAVHGPFAILKFPIPEDPGLVYIDTAVKGIFFEELDEIQRYEKIMNNLRAAALSQAKSRRLIDNLRKDIM
ncbi:helix-turn-helix domain-containing protein (plasmid) [Lentzea sp. JNUCC 0626]|uniref:helix-turn-helix domain-containing protein n=1 Tax=Lentzea sp. JNUCC 0626 TaxID=3367513 RepID=UPI0037479AF5